VCCSVLQRVAVCCIVGEVAVELYQQVVACCSVLQRVAACCSVLQRVAACCSVLQCIAVCCSALQRDTRCCSMLLCVAVCCCVCCSVPAPHSACPPPQLCLRVPTQSLCCSVLQRAAFVLQGVASVREAASVRLRAAPCWLPFETAPVQSSGTGQLQLRSPPVVQSVEVCCSVLQFDAVSFSVLCFFGTFVKLYWFGVLVLVICNCTNFLCCSVLKGVAVIGSGLLCVAMCCWCWSTATADTLHHIATYCITLHHTDTHCNTLHHTAFCW